jgi:hypothetical protein
MKHSLQNHLRMLLLVSACIFLNACGSDDRGYGCAGPAGSNGQPAVSVALTATDTNGQPIAGYGVTYQINNGAAQIKVCDSTEACVLGNGESGEFSINVYKNGFGSTSLKVTVTRGVCGLDSQRIVAKLKPLV